MLAPRCGPPTARPGHDTVEHADRRRESASTLLAVAKRRCMCHPNVEAQMHSLFVVSPTEEEDAEKQAPDHSFGLDLPLPPTQGTGSTGTDSSTDPYQYQSHPPDPEPPPTPPGNESEITDGYDDIEALFAGCVSTFQWDHGEEP